MKYFKYNSIFSGISILILTVFVSLIAASCNKIEDLTEVSVSVKDPEINIEGLVEGPNASVGNDVSQTFYGIETLSRDNLLGKYKDMHSKIKSITLDSATITITTNDESENRIITNYVICHQDNPAIKYSIPTYEVGKAYASPDFTVYVASVLNQLVKQDSLSLEYSGKTNIPAGKSISQKIKIYGIKVNGNVVNF